MSTRDNDPLHAAIDARLASLVANCPTPPAWAGPWRRLGPESSDEERLAVYRAIRSSGSLPEEAGFYLVSWQVDAMASRHAVTALRHLDDQLSDIERAYDLAEGDMWEPGEAPPEYAAVLRPLPRRLGRDLRGEARAVRRGRDGPALPRRPRGVPAAERGRPALLPRATPPGLGGPGLAGRAGRGRGRLPDGRRPDGAAGLPVWRGGRASGNSSSTRRRSSCWAGRTTAPWWRRASPWTWRRLRAAFDRVDDFGWNALGLHDADGPHVWVEGEYRGHDVWLRVLAQAPEDEDPGMKLDVSGEQAGLKARGPASWTWGRANDDHAPKVRGASAPRPFVGSRPTPAGAPRRSPPSPPGRCLAGKALGVREVGSLRRVSVPEGANRRRGWDLLRHRRETRAFPRMEHRGGLVAHAPAYATPMPRPGDDLDQPSVVGLGEGQLVSGLVEAVVPAVDPRRLAQQPRARRLPRDGPDRTRAPEQGVTTP